MWEDPAVVEIPRRSRIVRKGWPVRCSWWSRCLGMTLTTRSAAGAVVAALSVLALSTNLKLQRTADSPSIHSV